MLYGLVLEPRVGGSLQAQIEAERWRDALVAAVASGDDKRVDELWRSGGEASLWRPLGYDTAAEFTRAELGCELDEIEGRIATAEFLPAGR
jgi:hypothetical protein